MLNKREQLQIMYNKYKTQQKVTTSSALHQIRTDLINFGKICFNSGIEMQFGKPVKLPFLKNNKRQLYKRQDVGQTYRVQHPNKSYVDIKKDNQNYIDPAIYKKWQRSNSNFTKNIQNQDFKLSFNQKTIINPFNNNPYHLQTQNNTLLNTTDNYSFKVTTALPKILRYKAFNQQFSNRNILKLEIQQQQQSKYKIIKLLGQGTYADVYMAKHKNNNIVAIKIYDKLKIKDTEKLQNIWRQISILKKLHHPNIINFVQAIQTNKSIKIVTQLIQNTSLLNYLKSHPDNRLDQKQARIIFNQIIDAIQYLHTNNIIHRDLKLQNILITNSKKIKIIDFGFSIETNTKINIFCGTPSYISPQILLKKTYDGKCSDIWACGVLLYRIICGVFPFKGLNEKILYNKILKGIYELQVDLSKDLKALLQKLLDVDAKRRITIRQLKQERWIKNQ